jgi:hypothetical protein
MRYRLFVISMWVALMMAGGSLAGHHSFTAEFDKDKPVTVKGTVAKLEWVNPHAWLWIDSTREDGKVVHWSFELGAPTLLLRRGLTKDVVKTGIQVTVEGYRARSGLPVANARTVRLPDGRDLFAGSSGGDTPYAKDK